MTGHSQCSFQVLDGEVCAGIDPMVVPVETTDGRSTAIPFQRYCRHPSASSRVTKKGKLAMSQQVQYFDHSGRALSRREAFEADGRTIRDGVHLRVPHQLADHAVRFTDARQHRPGWRTIADNDPGRAVRDAAYQEYEERITSAWKSKAMRDAERVCPDCHGDGTDANGEDCEMCAGLGEIYVDEPQGERVRPVTADRRTVDQMSHDHQQRMLDEYLAYEKRLTTAWHSKG
jgi:hypothetical protein